MIELMLTILIIVSFCVIYNLYDTNKTIKRDTKNIYAKQVDSLQTEVNILRENKVDPTKIINISEYNRIREEHSLKIRHFEDEFNELLGEVNEEKEKNKKLVSQRQSNHVKLGQTAENFYAFINEFPHNPENCIAVFKPIDLISFEEDKITFIEIKTGNSQLSTKQRNIKRLVEENKVYFETHRINEKGVKIK